MANNCSCSRSLGRRLMKFWTVYINRCTTAVFSFFRQFWYERRCPVGNKGQVASVWRRPARNSELHSELSATPAAARLPIIHSAARLLDSLSAAKLLGSQSHTQLQGCQAPYQLQSCQASNHTQLSCKIFNGQLNSYPQSTSK